MILEGEEDIYELIPYTYTYSENTDFNMNLPISPVIPSPLTEEKDAFVPDLDDILQLDELSNMQEMPIFEELQPRKKSMNLEGTLGKDKLEEVSCLAMNAAVKDIDIACDILAVSTDPYSWTIADVSKWLQWTAQHYGLPMIQIENFYMNGATLCSLTEDQFKQYAPGCGLVLFAELDIWKTAASYQLQQPSPTELPAIASTVYDISSLDNSWASLYSPSHSSEASSDHSNDGASDSDEEVIQVQRSQTTIHLWQFIKELLADHQTYGNAIRWLDRAKGIFKIEDSGTVAKCWGKRKNRPAMNYDKLSRSLRQYYKKGILKKTERSQRLVYQFCPSYRM